MHICNFIKVNACVRSKTQQMDIKRKSGVALFGVFYYLARSFSLRKDCGDMYSSGSF